MKMPGEGTKAHNAPLANEVVQPLISHILAVQVALEQRQQLCGQLCAVCVHQRNACSMVSLSAKHM